MGVFNLYAENELLWRQAAQRGVPILFKKRVDDALRDTAQSRHGHGLVVGPDDLSVLSNLNGSMFLWYFLSIYPFLSKVEEQLQKVWHLKIRRPNATLFCILTLGHREPVRIQHCPASDLLWLFWSTAAALESVIQCVCHTLMNTQRSCMPVMVLQYYGVSLFTLVFTPF